MRKVKLGPIRDFADASKLVNVEGQAIIVAKLENGWGAVLNRCSHLPLPLAGGKVESQNGRTTITCPFHMSRFDLETGANLDWTVGFAGVQAPGWSRRLIALGKAPQPVQAFRVVEQDGELLLELP
jgi:nitrite reductase/ring-hydroxylating ferredoxin subunit